jgi:hypothetical protein
MIDVLQSGSYELIETKGQTKILNLSGDASYAWVAAENIGEILIASHKKHDADHILAVGEYKLYDVDGEPDLSDMQHLELQAGEDVWQGYLLLTGLPTETDTRNRIIPTDELITGRFL